MPTVATIQQASGTEITFRSSGGTGTITVASVAHNAARQSTKADFGANRARLYDVFLEAEMAATPTAGNEIVVYLNPSSSATAATDNLGGCSGSDAAYAGYSSNLDASIRQLTLVGSLITTAQATATVQKGYVGTISVPQRYGSVVVYNKAGSAFHSSDANCVLRFVPRAEPINN